jgi:hypothetical protein
MYRSRREEFLSGLWGNGRVFPCYAVLRICVDLSSVQRIRGGGGIHVVVDGEVSYSQSDDRDKSRQKQ